MLRFTTAHLSLLEKLVKGPSNLRQYILEQDLLEAIVAVPEKMFYNTGISTYIWVLANKKEERRKGKVQLIDATSFKKPLRKNLGEKNCEVDKAIREHILELYMAFDQADERYSKVFDTYEFGYWEVPVYTPKYDENGKPILDKKGKPVKPNSDKEIIPFTYEGGIEAFIENEVRPYAPDVFIKPGSEKIGYELSFTKYFYQPVQLRTLEEITQDIRAIERETDGLLEGILGG